MISGKESVAFIERVTTADIGNMKDNRSGLAMILNDEGGIMDDCIVTRINEN